MQGDGLQSPVPGERAVVVGKPCQDRTGALAYISQQVASMDLANSEILRVTFVFQAFENSFRALRGAPGADLYSKSQRSDWIQTFWSHSWHGQCWRKVLTLLAMYNGPAAIISGTLVAVAMMFLFSFQVLPEFIRGDEGLFRNRPYTGSSIWSVWSGFLITSLVMIFWRSQTRIFFDRICISEDRRLKSQAIVSLAGLLRRSDTMLILWDPTWTRRLWCLFELAAFLRSREQGKEAKLIITPTLLGPVCFGVLLCTSAGTISLAMVPLQRELMILNPGPISLVAAMVVGFTLVSHLRKYFRELDTMRQQLLLISFDTAECACCARNHVTLSGEPVLCDRIILKECVMTWFGDLEAFENTIRAEVLAVLTRDLERVLTTKSTIAVFAPIMWLSMDGAAVQWSVAGQLESPDALAFLLQGLCIWLVGMPTLKDWLLDVCKVARARPSNQYVEVMKNLLAVLSASVPIVCTMGCFVTLQSLDLLSPLERAAAFCGGMLVYKILSWRLGVVLKAFIGHQT